MLRTEDVSIGYDHCLLEHLNVQVEAGEFICLIGLNGSGKSTLLQSLCGLQNILSGNIYIDGKNIYSLKQEVLAKYFSLVLTDSIHVDNLSVFNLVAIGRCPHTNWLGHLTKQDKQIVYQAIEQVGLTTKMNTNFTSMSDGEKQRAMIAKVLAQDTPIVLLDEPTAYLDVLNRIHIMQLLKNLSKQMHKSFVVSTHELDLAMQVADKIWLIADNQLYVGAPEDLLLQNIFQQVFKFEYYHCEETSVFFHLPQEHQKVTIAVHGDDRSAQLMQKALERKGFGVAENASICILAKENTFEIDGKMFTAIADVLNYIATNYFD